MNEVGRPLKFKNPEDMEDAIDWYFFNAYYDCCGIPRLRPKKVSISGLAYDLGFESRRSITDYKQKDEFSPTIKRARLRIERYLEERLDGNNVTGIIFNLKNNFGWKDTFDQNIGVTITDRKFEFVEKGQADIRGKAGQPQAPARPKNRKILP